MVGGRNMPYIKKENRPKILNKIKSLSMEIDNPGELNYTISKLIDLLMKRQGEKYDYYNAVIGVLECVKLELYRRKVAPYENKKIGENGDI